MNCAGGHLWVEADGTPYVRHSGRTPGPVSVICRQCGTFNELEAHGAFTAPPAPHEIDTTTPPAFLEVLGRALQEPPKPTPAPVENG